MLVVYRGVNSPNIVIREVYTRSLQQRPRMHESTLYVLGEKAENGIMSGEKNRVKALK